MSNTMRRDQLLRLAKAGKLTLVGSYHFDDMLGASRSSGEMPVVVAPYGAERKEGVCYVREDEFSGNCGRAYYSSKDRSVVTLYVHSNSNYTFRINK